MEKGLGRHVTGEKNDNEPKNSRSRGCCPITFISTNGCHCQETLERELAAIRQRILTLTAELAEGAENEDCTDSASPTSMAASAFSAIPTELRLTILKSIPDVQTLLNFIIASRVDYDIYKRFDETILPNVILNKLANDSRFDLRKEADWAEFCVYPNPWDYLACSAIRSCYHQYHRGDYLKLDLLRCRALLGMREGRLWRSVGPDVVGPLEIVEPNIRFGNRGCVAEGEHQGGSYMWSPLYPYVPASVVRNEYLMGKHPERIQRE